MEEYLRELIRGIDSSLLEEWERLRNPDFVAQDASDKPARPSSFDITRDKPAFLRLTRTAIFGFLQDVAFRDWESAVERLRSGSAGSIAETELLSPEARKLEEAFAPYFIARSRFRLDPEGRSSLNTHVEENPAAQEWRIAQVLIDADDNNDWELRLTLSLADSKRENRPVLAFAGCGPIGT
jgi:hypothetical protein